MSDLEATRSREQTAAPLTRLAQDKLRSLASRGLGGGENEGALDAFAEVFAAIAATGPTSAEPDAAGIDSSPHNGELDRTDDKGDDQASDQVQADESADDDGDSNVAFAVTESAIATDQAASDDGNNDDISTALDGESDDPSDLANEQVVTSEVVDRSDSDQDAFDLAPQNLVNSQQDGKKRDSSNSIETGPEIDGPVTAHDPLLKDEAVKASHTEGEAEAFNVQTAAADQSDDRPRKRRSKRDPSDKAPAVEALSERQTAGKRPVNQATPLSLEGVAAPTNEPAPPQEPPPAAARKAAIAAVTGAPVQAVSGQSSSHAGASSNNTSRINGNGFTSTIDPAAPSKTDSKNSSKASKSAGESASEAVNRAKLIQRVTKAFQHLGPDGGVVRLRLAPAELGTVRVEMRIQGRNMNARVVAETEAASNALREHLPDLRSRLESFGMQIERIDVETDSDMSGSMGTFSGDQSDDTWSNRREPSSPPFPTRIKASVSRLDSSETVTVASGATSRGGVDLKL